jgi:hypothetical protein
VLKVPAMFTFMLVPLFAAMVMPAGKVQLYPVDPVTAAIEYVAVVNPHVTVGPDINPGMVAVVFNASAFAVPVPQMSVAATVMFPLVKPPVLDTVTAVVPCPPIMLIPEGAVHKYPVAPAVVVQV